MANEYTLHFSDPTKQETITVPAMPPGLNTVDTSLSLVGRGYPNYGQKFAENFLHLLENFASPLPPENPVEGQLWFDTSDSGHKVLRVMDGTASSVRWPSATGIYQQSTDPNNQYTAKNGDIWVDTAENTLKIWDGLNWQLVGPSSSSIGTGSVVEDIKATNGSTYPVIKNYVSGSVISIVSGLNVATFTPLSVIEGFQQIRPGITLSNKIQNGITSQIYGTASNAYNLRIENANYPSTEFLRKSDTSQVGQEITGKVVFRTNSLSGALGRDGIVILPTGKTTEYIQLYKDSNDAVLLNNTVGGKLRLQTNDNSLVTGLEIDPVTGVRVYVSSVLSNLISEVTTATDLTVTDNAIITGNLTVSGKSVFGNLTAAVTTVTQLTVANNLTVKDNGTVYAKTFANTGTTATFIGKLLGTATRFERPVKLVLAGQFTATIVEIGGDSSTATINASLVPAAISGQVSTSTASTSTSIALLDNADTTLKQITKKDFLRDIAAPGTIMLWGGPVTTVYNNAGLPSIVPVGLDGWIVCDGTPHPITDYPELFAVIANTYGYSGSQFGLPLLTGPSDQNNAAVQTHYIIKYQ